MLTYTHRHRLDVIWAEAAKRIGLAVRVGGSARAATDGEGVLFLSNSDCAADSLAHPVLHELCHGLVQGDTSLALVNWGLVFPTSGEDPKPEYAALRVQAALLDEVRLRHVLKSAGRYQAYYEALEDPFAPDSDGEVFRLALAGYRRSYTSRWSEALRGALDATRRVVQASCERDEKPGGLV